MARTEPTLRSTTRQRGALRQRIDEKERAALAVHFQAFREGKKAEDAGGDVDPAVAARAADAARVLADRSAEIAAMMAAAREKRELMAEHSVRKPRPGQFSHEPTPERTRQTQNGIVAEEVIPPAGPVKATNRHRVVDYVTKHRADLTMEEISVLDWIVDLAEASSHVNLTMNYGGASGGGNPGRKMGGLGNVPQATRDKFATFRRIEAGMHPGFVKTLRDMVLQIRFDDRPSSPAEFAAALFPTHRDKSFRAGVTIAAVKTLAWRLTEFYWRERALSRPSQPRRIVAVTTEVKS